MKTKTFNFTRIFCWLFVLTVPFNYHLIPNLGKWFTPVSEALTQWGSKYIFGLPADHYYQIISDSSGMYIHVFHLIILSFIISLFLKKKIELLNTPLPYFLSLMLFTYGFNKVFKYQFYFPEPNLLHTKLGMLSKDILYWSSMGTSYSYNLFMGMIEVIPATLLLFRKTRTLGALISLGVLVNVFFINIGFDISVKLLSGFLILISVLIITPQIKSLILFFSGKEAQLSFNHDSSPKFKYISLVAVIFILIESLFPYMKSGFTSGDNFKKRKWVGSYETISSSPFKNIHFHSGGYLITESKNGVFKDHKFTLTPNYLKLKNGSKLFYHFDEKYLNIRTDSSLIELKKIDLDRLPLFKDSFYWTLEGSMK